MSHGYSRQKLSILILISVYILLFLMLDRIHAKPVKTENGQVRGTVEDSLRLYRGVPYAAHTTGPLNGMIPPPPGKGGTGYLSNIDLHLQVK